MALEFTGERFVPSLRGQIYYEHLHRYAIAKQFAQGKRVLDIASGEGYGSKLLADTAMSVVGVDINQDAIEHARKSYYAPNLHFICGSCAEIPLPENSVDLVVSFETIEHVDDYRRMLDELHRVLTPDGTLIISSPNKLVYSDASGDVNPYHVRELYYNELRDELANRFPAVSIFGQRIAASSLVFPLHGSPPLSTAWYFGNVVSVQEGLPALSDPVYFLAVCGQLAGDLSSLSSAFVDPNDDLLLDLHREVLTMRNERRAEVLEADGPTLLPTSTLSLPAPEPDSHILEDTRQSRVEMVRLLNYLTESAEVTDYEMPGADADELSFVRSFGSELSKVVQKFRELTVRRDGLEKLRIVNAASEVKIAELELALAHSRETISAMRESAQAWQLDRLGLAQAHVNALRATEHEADRRASMVVAEAHSELEKLRTKYETTILEYQREHAVLDSILASRSWRITKPLRMSLLKLRSKKSSAT
jgi:ubiquinone/menaquinone biosynthesis C-methylase UbiE